MSFTMETVSKIIKRLTPSFGKKIPVVHLRGPISRQMSNYLSDRLQSVNKSHKYLAVVVNSKGGSLSQAHIMSNKLNQIVNQNKLQLLTFAQQFALNAGLIVLLSGNKVYVDTNTVLGGLQNGETVVRYGKLTQLISKVNYYNQSSYTGGIQQSGQISKEKGQQIRKIYQEFSLQTEAIIKKVRINKIQEINLRQLYTGQNAVKNGLADQIGRVYSVLPKLDPESSIKLLRISKIQKIKNALKKIKTYQF